MAEPRIIPSPAELKEQLEAERQGLPFLLFRDDKGSQHIVTLTQDRDSLSVGRHDECDLCLPWDARASRLHAMLTRSGGSWTVYDGGLSRNGTFLNNERVEGHRVLHDGDRLLVGATAIRFRDTGPKQRTTVMRGEAHAGPHVSAAEKKVLLALCAPYRHDSVFAKPASNKEIAAQLVLSVDTVKSHLRSLFDKFGLESLSHYEKRVRLVQQAFRLGVVRVSDFDEIGRK
jgi:pSer/pThr/pTyr-binding forkhead associated (FHA) protein